MLICKGITFNKEQCRLKYKMVDSIEMNTNIIRTLRSVQFSCSEDAFLNMHERGREVMLILMMLMPIPGFIIIMVIIMSVMITWKTRRTEATLIEMGERIDNVIEVKQTSSVYENLTFVG